MNNPCCENSSCACENMTPNKMCQQCQPPNAFDIKKVIEQINNPTHLCCCCGRVANDSENLCRPLILDEE